MNNQCTRHSRPRAWNASPAELFSQGKDSFHFYDIQLCSRACICIYQFIHLLPGNQHDFGSECVIYL